jgi:hypothetical protein
MQVKARPVSSCLLLDKRLPEPIERVTLPLFSMVLRYVKYNLTSDEPRPEVNQYWIGAGSIHRKQESVCIGPPFVVYLEFTNIHPSLDLWVTQTA